MMRSMMKMREGSTVFELVVPPREMRMWFRNAGEEGRLFTIVGSPVIMVMDTV